MKPLVLTGSVTFSPAGISTAGQARVRVTGSFWVVYMGFRSFRADAGRAVGQRGPERLPGQARAFHAARILADAGQRRELLHLLVGIRDAREHVADRSEQAQSVVDL